MTKKYLKRIGEELGIPSKLTTYTARNSFVTKLKNSEKVSLSFIMESLGHSSIKTTIDYLAEFPVSGSTIIIQLYKMSVNKFQVPLQVLLSAVVLLFVVS